MENSTIGFFLYYFFTGIFIYLCLKILKENDNKNNDNK